MLKLGISCLYSYPLFNPDCRSPFGGSEVRLWLIARELAKSGRFDVNVIVFDHGQPWVEQRQGVKIYARPGVKCPLTVVPEGDLDRASLRSRLPGSGRCSNWLVTKTRAAGSRIARRWRSVKWRRPLGPIGEYKIDEGSVDLYDEIGADIYIMHGNNLPAAEMACYCKNRRRKMVFLAGSDGDYHPGYKENPQAIGIYGLPGYLLNYAIEKAHAHVVQNERQQDLLRRVYGRNSVVVKNPVDLDRAFPRAADADEILWIGKSDWIKRPEIVLDMAERLPEYRFTVIMTFSNPQIDEQCRAKARRLPNVTLLDYVPFLEVENHVASAKLLVNTSVFEGFPNTFLQAAKYGVPIVSHKVDPGEMLSRYGCGLVGEENPDVLADNVRLLMGSAALHADASDRCLRYLRDHHDKDKVIPQYENLLNVVASSESVL